LRDRAFFLTILFIPVATAALIAAVGRVAAEPRAQ